MSSQTIPFRALVVVRRGSASSANSYTDTVAQPSSSGAAGSDHPSGGHTHKRLKEIFRKNFFEENSTFQEYFHKPIFPEFSMTTSSVAVGSGRPSVGSRIFIY